VEQATEVLPEALPLPTRSQTAANLTAMDGLLVLAMVIWATNYSVAKAALEVMPPFVFNTLRFSAGAVTLLVLMKASGEKLILPRREWLPLIYVSFLGNAVYQVLFLNGLHQTSVAHSVLITTIAPIGVVVYNIWRKKERGSRRVALGIVLALGGVGTVILSRYAGQMDFSPAMLIGDGLMLASAVIWVINTLALGPPLERNPALAASFWMLLWGILFAAILAAPDFLRFDWSQVKPESIRGILYSGVISIGGASTIWSFAIKRLGTSRTAIFVNLQPIIAAIIAALFLGEAVTPWLVVGTVIALTGMWLVRRG
jgi:drug/metabolite transporter (DMT)-like permease